MLVLNGKCEGKCAPMLCCCDLTFAESAGMPQIILNLKRQVHQKTIDLHSHPRHDRRATLYFCAMYIAVIIVYNRKRQRSATFWRF